ncbi:hypothetical protein C8R44DRAFT_731947 [Mycena epipterygia]|nr:hypothetical protein C8R44DRAFT_731947 [Mycena epipterygia]
MAFLLPLEFGLWGIYIITLFGLRGQTGLPLLIHVQRHILLESFDYAASVLGAFRRRDSRESRQPSGFYNEGCRLLPPRRRPRVQLPGDRPRLDPGEQHLDKLASKLAKKAELLLVVESCG